MVKMLLNGAYSFTVMESALTSCNGRSFFSQVMLNGWSPWLLAHINWVRIPSVMSSSNRNGAMRGGTEYGIYDDACIVKWGR